MLAVLALASVFFLSTPRPVTVGASASPISRPQPPEPPPPERTLEPPPVPSKMGGSYLLPESDRRRLTEADLEGLDSQELTLAANEIYARHGRPFDDALIRSYFEAQGWYLADPDYSDGDLSELERANAAFIRDYQRLHDLNEIVP